MASLDDLPFNRKPSTVMHLDLNSCFATIEQQANPLYRGRPLAVAAYTTSSGCIIAPSVEAKRLGVKLGMRVKEGKLLCPDLVVLPPDPGKYRFIHRRLRQLISQYTASFSPKSIDEFVLNFEGYPSFSKGLFNVAHEIKYRLKSEIGDWLTLSVGIGPNHFLAKTASNLKKPDGLEEINWQNYEQVYSQLKLSDLCGIKQANVVRLNSRGIYTVLDFYRSEIFDLKSAFHSILGYYWYLRLHGWEIDDVKFSRKSFGAMYSLPKIISAPEELSPILHKLVDKTALRLRHAGFKAHGVHLSLLYRNHSFWHHGKTVSQALFDTRDIYRLASKIMSSSPYRAPVANLAVSVFDLEINNSTQLDLFNQVTRSLNLTAAIDQIKAKYGDFIVTPAMMLGTEEAVPDRVGFSNIRDLEDLITS